MNDDTENILDDDLIQDIHNKSEIRRTTTIHKKNINNGWNENLEKLLSYWKEESQIFIWLNTQSLNYLKFQNKCLSVPAIAISAISSATIFSNVSYDDRSNNPILLYIIGSFLIISTFIQLMKEYLNLDKNIRQHINTIKTNQMLILDIQEQLSQGREDRINGKDFLNKMKTRKADLIRNSIEIPVKFYKRMENAIERGEIINYNETFVLYNYLQNRIANKNLIGPPLPIIPSSSSTATSNNQSTQNANDVLINIQSESNEHSDGSDGSQISSLSVNSRNELNRKNSDSNSYAAQIKYQIARL
jgi:hypothetical protein